MSWSRTQARRILRSVPRVDRPELFAHEPVEHDAHALNQTEEHRPHDGAPDHVFGAAPGCHDSPRRRSAHDRIPRVFLLTDVSEGAVEAEKKIKKGKNIKIKRKNGQNLETSLRNLHQCKIILIYFKSKILVM